MRSCILQAAIAVATLERIIATARQRPFESVSDLCTRVPLTPLELERLIAAGALDELAPSRRQARWEAQLAHARPADQASLLDDQTWPRSPAVEPESTVERALEEYETLGFPVSVDHPLCLYQAELAGTSLRCSARLALEVGRQVVVAGVIVAGRRIRTAGGRLMAFASLCDRTGVIELTLFEAAAERYRDLLSLHQVVVVQGLITADAERGVGLEVRRVEVLGGPAEGR